MEARCPWAPRPPIPTERVRPLKCQVPGLMEARFSRSGGLPGGFCDGVQGLVLDGRDQAELAV